jgi:glycosyltransferase involved in cell wall biosynthesis
MKCVLLPSDNRDWVLNFAEGYRRHGFEVAVGALNFELEASSPDIVHLNWPEELTGGRCPSETELAAVLARLDRWAARAWIIASVNNLYPHRQPEDPMWRRLYNGVYKRADVIQHFSKMSMDLVRQEFPEVADKKHVVHVGFNYERLLSYPEGNRERQRAELGLRPDDIAILCFGALRFWDEVKLIQRGFKLAKVPNKRLVMAARYDEDVPLWRLRFRKLRLKVWQLSRKVARRRGFVPEAGVRDLFAAADVVLVVRRNSLGSGIPSLAMTLGRPVVAPSVGGIPEYLHGAGNVLYDPRSARSLAAALERMAMADREAIGLQNRKIASGWGWDKVIGACLAALPATFEAEGLSQKSPCDRGSTTNIGEVMAPIA